VDKEFVTESPLTLLKYCTGLRLIALGRINLKCGRSILICLLIQIMSNQQQGSNSTKTSRRQRVYESLTFSDLVILQYLFELKCDGGRELCIASIPQISGVCELSERQVQISTRRLITANLLERVGYDLGNPNRKKRGTIYKVLINGLSRTKYIKCCHNKKKGIKFLLCWSDK
jgi:hypothetical protein